jgi:hypothetical protein
MRVKYSKKCQNSSLATLNDFVGDNLAHLRHQQETLGARWEVWFPWDMMNISSSTPGDKVTMEIP